MPVNYPKLCCPDVNSSYLGCETGCPQKCPFNKTVEKPLYKWKDGILRTVKEPIETGENKKETSHV